MPKEKATNLFNLSMGVLKNYEIWHGLHVVSPGAVISGL